MEDEYDHFKSNFSRYFLLYVDLKKFISTSTGVASTKKVNLFLCLRVKLVLNNLFTKLTMVVMLILDKRVIMEFKLGILEMLQNFLNCELFFNSSRINILHNCM